ncbi:MAG: sensor histidine kinase [Bacillota bacterium]
MRELSLHILDVVQNSLTAEASIVNINIYESPLSNFLRIEIGDNGKGIAPDKIRKVIDPFYTTRTSRKVGLGLSLFKAAAERSGGDFSIQSQPGSGTAVVATFKYDDIDRAPLGNMPDTILSLVIGNPAVDFCYRHRFEENVFVFDTRELSRYISRSVLESPVVAVEIREYLSKAISKLQENRS